MKKISGEEFKNLLYKENAKEQISNFDVEIEDLLIIEIDKLQIKTILSNFRFNGKTLKFIKKNSDTVNLLSFSSCEFLCAIIHFDNCSLFELTFISNKFNSNLFLLNNCKINNFKLNEENVFEEGNFEIYYSEFESNFEIENVKFIDFNSLKIENSNLKIENSNFNCNVSIINNEINQLIVSNSIFKEHFDYFGNKPNNKNNSSFFNKCEFNYSSFFETKFNNDTHFADCKFLNVTKFEKTGDEIRTTLRFDHCEFVNQVSFDKSRIHKLLFNNVSFNNIVSLQETYFDIVDINRTIFEKQAYFDDIQIKQIEKCDRKTIRTIKLQLQKAENKIDYNKFRVYEFNAYRKDIKKKLKEFEKDKNHLNHRLREPVQLKRDIFILWISDIVSEYGTDWKRAFKFTFWSGFSIYLLFYMSENYNHTIETSNWDNWTILISGFFRFFLVTDFYNPLVDDRVYLTNPLSWIIFIFGKVVIAFGIYEMIQSFRKFKA
jgi:hypothetical protein